MDAKQPGDPPADPSALLSREPQQARSRRTLERLLDAAWTLLEAEGPDGVTVTGVASRAGVSVGSFYARFEGKEELLRYMEATALDTALSGWAEVGGDAGVADPEALLRGLVTLYLEGPARRLHLLARARLPGSDGRLEAFHRKVAETLASHLGEGDPAANGSPATHANLRARAVALVAGARELAMAAGDPNRSWIFPSAGPPGPEGIVALLGLGTAAVGAPGHAASGSPDPGPMKPEGAGIRPAAAAEDPVQPANSEEAEVHPPAPAVVTPAPAAEATAPDPDADDELAPDTEIFDVWG
jgi:AcrR family transcriptional regulator